MRNRVAIVLSLVAVLGLGAVLRAADEKKEVTLKGTLTCAKCQLKEAEKCQNVLVVKAGDKTDKYYLTDTAISKTAHDAVCGAAKENVTVTGSVEDKEGKKWLAASKIEGLDQKKD